jgi:hypothetical protein
MNPAMGIPRAFEGLQAPRGRGDGQRANAATMDLICIQASQVCH